MSPEQARGEKLDARTDVFSFGVLFYEMLSGQQPFRRASMAETISAILTHEPPLAENIDWLKHLKRCCTLRATV
jgi:serine/threonine protein kinase